MIFISIFHSAVWDIKLNLAHSAQIRTRHSVGSKPTLRRIIMWTIPAATEMRFGFEVTMYVMNK